jgi:hypothetical protein
MNVIILGDKEQLLSKNAVVRLKGDIKILEQNKLEPSKYLKDGYGFTFEVKDNTTTITIVEKAVLEQSKLLEEKRTALKNQLKQARMERHGASQMKQKLASLKRSVPTKVYNSYVKLISRYNLSNIPPPDEVINNVDKYRLQISAVLGKVSNLSDDPNVSNAIYGYFSSLGNLLGIEALTIKTPAVP